MGVGLGAGEDGGWRCVIPSTLCTHLSPTLTLCTHLSPTPTLWTHRTTSHTVHPSWGWDGCSVGRLTIVLPIVSNGKRELGLAKTQSTYY